MEENNILNKVLNDDEKQNSETAINDIKNEVIDMEKIFIDPVSKLYEPFYNSFNDQFYKMIKEEIIKNTNIDKKVKELDSDISNKRKEINNAWRTNKIGGRKFSNVLIGILFVILIGLFFIKFFIKNRKIIKEYNDFKYKKNHEIIEVANIKSHELINVFGYYDLNYLKNLFLQKYGITKIKNIKYDEINVFEKIDGFAGFNYISKYDIRNSCVYDLIYSTIEYREITTSKSITISVPNTSGEGSHWETLTAYHTEITPFINFSKAITIPTNYLPSLTFTKSGNGYKESEIKKARKSGKTLLENDDFNKSISFYYNDEVKFLQYFTLVTQNNFLKVLKKFPINNFAKYNNNLYVYFDFNLNNSSYDKEMNWLINYVNTSIYSVNVDKIIEELRISIWVEVNNIFKMLTISYSNKNVFAESFEEVGNSYVANYKDDNTYSTENNSNFFELSNIFNSTNIFNWTKKYDLRRKNYYEAHEFKKDKEFTSQNIVMKSWHAVDEIDTVSVQGYLIDVPYVRFYPIEESKNIIFTNNYHLTSPDSFVQTLDSNRQYLNFLKDKYYDDLIQKNNILINEPSFKYLNEVKDAIITIDNFYKQFPELKQISKIIISDSLFGIFINDTQIFKLDPIKYSLNNISKALKRLYSAK